MKFNFNITNTMIGHICKDFYLLPTVNIYYIDMFTYNYYTISLKCFAWEIAFTLIKKIGQ
jgi:hypothetical protein